MYPHMKKKRARLPVSSTHSKALFASPNAEQTLLSMGPETLRNTSTVCHVFDATMRIIIPLLPTLLRWQNVIEAKMCRYRPDVIRGLVGQKVPVSGAGAVKHAIGGVPTRCRLIRIMNREYCKQRHRKSYSYLDKSHFTTEFSIIR